MSIRLAAQRYPGPAAAGAAARPSSPGGAAGPGSAGSRGRGPRQLAQMFWLAVRDEIVGEGVGADGWIAPAVWVVVP